MGSNRIIHNTEDRTAGDSSFLINDADHICFQDIPKFGAVPFPMIQEMGDRGSVIRACLCKINYFASVTIKENRAGNVHQMMNIYIR